MNFEFSDQQKSIREQARLFAVNDLLPGVVERDEKGMFNPEHFKKLGEMGFFGLMADPAFGGKGYDTLSFTLAIEEISKIDPSVSVVLSVCNSLVNWATATFAREEVKLKYLPKLTSGEFIGAFLLSEPDASSDAAAQTTMAVDKGDHFLLNGTKKWITNASIASVYIVIAQSNPEKGARGINAFLVEKNSHGITLGPNEDKMGMRSSDTHEVYFDNVRLPKENLLGEPGSGFYIAMKALESGRIGIAAQATGIAAGAFELAVKYANRRKTFNTEIINHQAVAFKLADMAVKVENARNLYQKAAWLKDSGKPYGIAGSMAKQYCADIAMEVTTDAVQIHGGYGYIKEYRVERLMRDAKVTQIYEGTSEIQKIVIARSLVKKTESIYVESKD
jgi:alkylation response protein AidB-like acyl-CoA dehydrogenase